MIWASMLVLAVAVGLFVGPHAVSAIGFHASAVGLSGLALMGVLKTGTYDISALLAANNQSLASYGTDRIAQILAADNESYNAQVDSFLADFTLTTTDRQVLAGSSIGGNMVELDEYGRPPTQKDIPGYLVGLPLRKFGFATGWTQDYLDNATPADLAIKQQAAQAADLRRTRYEIATALFNATNFSFVDALVDNVALPAKALINADSSPMQNGPNGEVFDGTTHTHFDGSATLTAAAVSASVTDVAEHRIGVKLRIYINQADAAAFALLAGFTPLNAAYLQQINLSTSAILDPRLDITKTDNRMIGYFNAAEVWTKPWVSQNYLIVIDTAAPIKPLARRVRPNDRGLYIAAQLDTHPLHAQYFQRYQGFAAWGRVAAAVLKFNNATYAVPALTF